MYCFPTILNQHLGLAQTRLNLINHQIFLIKTFAFKGISIAMLGPSLLDLKEQVNASFKGISTIFTVRSVGYLLGSIVAGWLFDRWNGYIVLTGACFVASITMIVTPFTKSYFALVVTIVCQGLALGSLDTGNVFCGVL